MTRRRFASPRADVQSAGFRPQRPWKAAGIKLAEGGAVAVAAGAVWFWGGPPAGLGATSFAGAGSAAAAALALGATGSRRLHAAMVMMNAKATSGTRNCMPPQRCYARLVSTSVAVGRQARDRALCFGGELRVGEEPLVSLESVEGAAGQAQAEVGVVGDDVGHAVPAILFDD